MLLSICIPTFKNTKTVIKNVKFLQNEIASFGGSCEIVIAENFYSNTDREALLETVSGGYTKLICNTYNVGFSRNLFTVLNSASGKYILLMGDDDFLDDGLLRQIYIHLNLTNEKSLFFVPLDLTPNPGNLSKRDLLSWVFMRSGSMMGIVFHRDAIYLDEIHLDNSIYMQIHLSMLAVLRHGYSQPIFSSGIKVGLGLPLEKRFSDKIGRPIDYGTIERAKISRELYMKNIMSYSDYISCRIALTEWTLWVLASLLKVKSPHRFSFGCSILFGSPDKLLTVLLAIYLISKRYLLRIKLFIQIKLNTRQ
jgi:glycosyltransferase involved in cell wall biosynthesis